MLSFGTSLAKVGRLGAKKSCQTNRYLWLGESCGVAVFSVVDCLSGNDTHGMVTAVVLRFSLWLITCQETTPMPW